MVAKALRKLTALGFSTSGSKHDLEIEETENGGYKFTILGPTGKRHASVLITDHDGLDIEKFLKDSFESRQRRRK